MGQEYTSLKNTRLIWTPPGSSEIIYGDAIEIVIPLAASFFDRTPGSSWFTHEVPGEMSCVMKVKGWTTDSLGPIQLVPFSRIATFRLLSTEAGTPSVLPANFFTWFPVNKMMIGNTNFGFRKEPDQYETEIRCNVRGEWGGNAV